MLILFALLILILLAVLFPVAMGSLLGIVGALLLGALAWSVGGAVGLALLAVVVLWMAGRRPRPRRKPHKVDAGFGLGQAREDNDAPDARAGGDRAGIACYAGGRASPACVLLLRHMGHVLPVGAHLPGSVACGQPCPAVGTTATAGGSRRRRLAQTDVAAHAGGIPIRADTHGAVRARLAGSHGLGGLVQWIIRRRTGWRQLLGRRAIEAEVRRLSRHRCLRPGLPRGQGETGHPTSDTARSGVNIAERISTARSSEAWRPRPAITPSVARAREWLRKNSGWMMRRRRSQKGCTLLPSDYRETRPYHLDL
jgi:hypothetical protein